MSVVYRLRLAATSTKKLVYIDASDNKQVTAMWCVLPPAAAAVHNTQLIRFLKQLESAEILYLSLVNSMEHEVILYHVATGR